jgi:NADP-dependent 3-hydroxy acid dehydrogenase YdfG
MKNVLISGGNSGLGLEVTKILLTKGYAVTILGKNQQALDKVKDELNSSNLSCIQCDLRNYEEIHQKISSINNLDILINCAGIIAYKKLDEQDPKNIKDIIETNLLGTIYLTKELLPIFKKQNSGIIMNISSTSGLMTGGHAEESVYVASKYGVTGFTETLRKEMIEQGNKIKVLGFYPGGMNTKLFSKADLDKDTSKFMDPREIAEIIVFIIERPDSINMDNVVVNRNKN